jgi:hypothetical protein
LLIAGFRSHFLIYLDDRLKLKCDGQGPCGSCVKRGVATLCPDGAIHYLYVSSRIHSHPPGAQATGRGHQYVLVLSVFPLPLTALRSLWNSTTELRAKLAEFAERIQQLEDALRVAHAAISHGLHPLLSDELLRIKESAAAPTTESMADDSSPSQASAPSVELLDRFGSLSISLSGGSKHFGHAANSWVRIFRLSGVMTISSHFLVVNASEYAVHMGLA